MRGHVRKRGSSWSIVFDAGRDPDTGRRRQRWQGGFRTKREAEASDLRKSGSFRALTSMNSFGMVGE